MWPLCKKRMSTLLSHREISDLNQRQTSKYKKCCDAVDGAEQGIKDLAEELQKTKARAAELKESLAAAKNDLTSKRGTQRAIATDLRTELAQKGAPRR